MRSFFRRHRREHEKHLSPGRYVPFAICVAVTVFAALHEPRSTGMWALFLIAGALTLLGVYDLVQRRHAVRRNYPVIGNLRWLLESIRPEIRQYLIEGDNEQAPFSRAQRSLVYARSKNEGSELAFGTLLDVYDEGYEFMAHSTRPAPPADPAIFRVPVGGADCEKPYSAALRELYEETNIKSVTKLGQIPGWLIYDIPKKFGKKAWGGKYRGQAQKWYALRFTGKDSEIDIENPGGGHEPEFVEWRWEPMKNLPDLVVPFKRRTYEQVVKAFSKYAKPKASKRKRAAKRAKARRRQ